MKETSRHLTAAEKVHMAIGRRAALIQWLSAGLIVVALLLLMRTLPIDRGIEWLRGWIEGLGVWGAVLFGLIYVAAVLLFLPGWVLTVAAGAVYGLVQATIIVSLASTTGAALAFLITRYVAREKVARQIGRYPKFEAVDRAIGEQGWKIVALLRLSPAVPFNLQNYLYGLTAIRFWPCVLASWIAMLPGTFMYVYLGSLGGTAVKAAADGDTATGWGEWTLRIVGGVATVAVTVYVTQIARKAMNERTAIEENEGDSPEDETSAPEEQIPLQKKARSALLTLGVAVILLAAAGWAYWQQEFVRKFLEQFLGMPPTQ